MANLTFAKQIKKNKQGPVVIEGFAVGFETVTAATIAFADSNPDTITDSGSGLAGFAVGQTLLISGGVNDGAVVTIDAGGVSAGTLTLIAGDSLTAAVAGPSITLSVVGEDVASDLTTAAATGGNDGVAVTDVPSTAFDVAGWGVTAPENYVLISDDTSRAALSDSSGREIFSRITEDTGVYTLSHYVLIAGVETPYAFTSAQSIKFIPPYNFELDDYPFDADARVLNARLLEDASGGIVPDFAEAESNTVTGDDTFSALANTPLSGAKVTLIINSETYMEDVHFTRSGTALTWTFTKGSPNFGFTVKTTDDVHAYYRY